MKPTHDNLPIKSVPTGPLSTRLHSVRKKARHAFTLVELLVVVALTALLLALLFAPIIQGFKLTNKARALAEAQDASRFGMERIKRELSQAAYVFDNTNTPVTLPLEDPANPRSGQYPGLYPTGTGGGVTTRPNIAFAKIDFIPTANRAEDPNQAIDPTTNQPVGGAPIVLPVSPSRHYVRYFVGLRQNTRADGATRVQEYYRNVYEFPRTDNDLNPFVLYRVEYDPKDPNFVDPRATAFQEGGLHDPNFFYNMNVADPAVGGNGRTYAENWKNAASPVLGTTNLDLLAWRRDATRQVVQGSSFQLAANFGPGAVAGDTATPGFTTGNIAETPGAVPSVYTAQYGQWTFPFSVTVFRGSTQFGGTRALGFEPFGTTTFSVEQVIDAGTGATRLQVFERNRTGSLVDSRDTNYYWLQDSATGRIVIFTPNLALQLDPTRGRVETSFPPLATTSTGTGFVPLFVAPNGTMQAMQPGPDGNFGQLIPLLYRRNTRDDDTRGGHYAGMPYGDGTTNLPVNQGILVANLASQNYFFAAPPYPAITSLPAPSVSPFVAFGSAGAVRGNFRGIMLVPGSEQVLGPDNTLSTNGSDLILYTYSRQPVRADVLKTRSITGVDPNRRYLFAGPLQYKLENTLGGTVASPHLIFDDVQLDVNNNLILDATNLDAFPGMPARAASDGQPQGEVRVSFLWQNNYSRNSAGEPVNPTGEAIYRGESADDDGSPVGAVRPEADVVKVDYSTRQLINLNIGARVYDSSSGQPQTASVGDQVKVGNVSR